MVASKYTLSTLLSINSLQIALAGLSQTVAGHTTSIESHETSIQEMLDEATGILAQSKDYTDEQRAKDIVAYENLVQMAIDDMNDPYNYKNMMAKEKESK